MFSWLWQEEERPRGEQPLFYEVVQPTKAKHGESAVFTAKVRGHPTPKVLWYHGESEIPLSEDFAQEFNVATGTVQLKIKEVFIDDKGLYKAVAINEHGVDETTGYLTVEDLEILEKTDLRQAPQITVPIEAQVLPIGSPVVMRAKYEAFPPPTIKWYKETKEIKPSTEFVIESTEDSTTLQINELYEDDHGEYQVRIFNEAGEARSAATIAVTHLLQKVDLQPPQFTKTVAPQIVPEGEVAILEAEVTAEPEAEFAWFKHGEEVLPDEDLEIQITSGANKSTLIIGELYEDDSGDYTVTATNPAGKASSTATLVVEGEMAEHFEAPEFCPPLTPIRVMDGEQVRFTCKVKAQPRPKISWFHNGRPIDHHREVKVMQTPEGRVGLLVTEVFPEDAGDYTCVARNRVGEARCTTTLTVESYEYHPDSEAATLASVSDKQILSGTASEDEILDIEKDSDSDTEAGSAPFFSNKLETVVEVIEGSPVRLVAKAEGYPRPDIVWYVDEKPIDNSEEMNLENIEDGTVVLNIPQTVTDHCGIYICEAMNRNGIDTTASQLIVLPQEHSEGTSEQYRKPEWVKRMEVLKETMEAERVAPTFIQEIYAGRVKEMETHTFTATFTGNPKPEITWYHGERLLHQSQTHQMRVRGDKAILTIVQVSPEHKGNYICKAANSVGEVTCTASLEVIELSYEEKLKIDNERYAALQIQHAAEHMKVKEAERREKVNQEQKIALSRLKEERKYKPIENKKDEDTNIWKKQLKKVEKIDTDKASKPQKPMLSNPAENCIAHVYSGWKKPIALEASYPELQPNEFAPNQVPGVKCFVKVSETSMKGEEVVKEIAPQFFEDEQVIAEIAKVHSLLKQNVRINEIWSMFRAGEFKHLQQPKVQTALVKICEYIGHKRNVSMVLAEETQEQAKQSPVGLKALLRMVKHAKDIRPDHFFKEVIPRECGQFSSTTQELQKVSQMINQGIENEMIIATCEAGKLPTLKKPETQQPLINIVEKQGHTVMVAQVLVEEAYKDAQEELCVPGFKALVNLATEGNVDLESIELKPLEKQQFEKDIAKLSFSVKKGVQVRELMTMLKEDEFPSLKLTESQPIITDVVDKLQRATVKEVLVKEAKAQPKKLIGTKSIMKTIETGKQSMEEVIMDISKEFGPHSEPVKEIATIGHLLNEGVKCNEVITLIEAGQFPALKKPQLQSPMVSMVTKKGHASTVCEVIIEESTEDIGKFKPKEDAAKMEEIQSKLKQAKSMSVTVKTFKPEMVPGAKAIVKMAKEENVEEKVQKAEMSEVVKKEIIKIVELIRHGVIEEQVMQMMETGEFPELTREENQATILDVVEDFGYTAVINEVIIEQAVQKKEQNIAVRALIRMAQQETFNIDHLLTETLPHEFAPEKQEPIKEVAKVSLMVKEGIQAEEIISLVKAGEFPELSKPEYQIPLVRAVKKEGHSPIVCQVLIEETVKEISKDLPKVDKALIVPGKPLHKAAETEVIVQEHVVEITLPRDVKPGDQLRAISTYLVEDEHENAMHLIEGERVIVQECTNSDWWFVEKYLTKERGYVPAKLLAEEDAYIVFVQKKLEEKIDKLPTFDKPKKGQKASAPRIIQRVEPQVVVDGQEVQFTCKVEGVPRPTITWFRQTAIIKQSEEFQMFYSEDGTATLIIKEVFPEDAGIFTCVIKNQAGSTSSSAELVVEGPMSDHGTDSVTPSRRSLSRESSVCDLLEGIPPTFAQKSMTKTSEENVTLEMDVRLVAIPEPEIIWRRDGQVVRDSNRIRIVKQKDVHAYRSIVIIKGVRKDDEGVYEIFARNREGEARNTITLNITAPEAPEFIERLKETTVEEGETIRLVARFKGHPTPDVTWSSTFKKGLESCVVKEDMEVVLECRTSKEVECEWQKNKKKLNEEHGRVTIERQGLTHRVIISTAQVSDTAKYRCVFKETSTWCNLTVKGQEEFVKNLEDQEVMEKEEAVFQVEINNETSEVTWHKDGQEITRDDQRFKIIKEGKTRKLILKSSTPDDQGEYTCCMGDLESTAELVVKERPAEIVRKMTDQLVYKGRRAIFEIELSKPNVVVQWFKNEDEIHFDQHFKLSVEGKVQRLTIYNCQMEDGAFFRASVGKSECSAVLTVELQEEGDFVKKLQTQMDVTAGSDVTLTVQITKPEYDVRWLRNGEKIEPSDRFIIEKENNRRSLILKSTKLEDAADYTCVLGKVKSTCKLNVLKLESPPTIDRSQIQVEYVVKKGETVTFTVPFKATPTPTASWTRKGKQIRPEGSKKYTSETTENRASITVKQVENIDCGEYRLELKNSCGNVSIDITLKILDKPSKPGWPEILQVTNDSVNIHWREPEDDGGRKITNYIVEYRFKSKTSWSVFNKNFTIKETTTIVTHLQTNEEYHFRVSAVNEIGTSEPSEESQPVKICMPKKPEPPMVLEELQPVVTGLYQTVVLRCVISGTPLPTIKWTKDSQEITSNVTYENFTATLTIRETSGSSAGTYTCKASNEAGVNECSASVVVQETPKFEFDEALQAQCLYVGDRWQIPIKVTGFPQPKISWTRNDKSLKSSQHIIVHVEEEEGLTDIAIQKVQKDDSAVFTCMSENSAGKASISFNLRVQEVREEEEEIIFEDKEEIRMERPGAPEGPLIIKEITTTKVQLTWKASSYDGGCEISSYCIERLIQGEKHWQKEGEVKANITTYITQDLLEEHEYFFRVFAVNAIGLSDALEGDSVFIRSRFGVPGPPLGPFDVTMLTDYSLKIQWEQPDFDGGSPITGYLVERREAFKKAWQKVGNTEAEETEYEISGLKRGVSYFFRVFAINKIGQGPPFQPEEPITAGKKITVPSMPTGLNVIDVTSRTVTLGWAPPATTGGADLIGYVIQSRLTSQEKWQSIVTVDPSVTLYCIENLIEKSEYEFRVYAENPVGWSEEAATTEYIKLKTHATPPSPPTSPLEARPTGPTSLMIEWGAPESDGGAPLLGYTIAIRDMKRSMWIEVGQVDANFTRLHIKELQENHEYIVRVFARNEVGLSDPLELEDPIQIIRPDDFTELPEDDDAPSLSYSTTETLSWMREAGVDADIYSYARGRLLNRDEYFFKLWHQRQRHLREDDE